MLLSRLKFRETDEVGLSTDTIFIDDDNWNIPENNRVTITGRR